ncbi:hypothetical protein [Streptomyces sp. DH41]|uniref:hypothetical protein n=1 Tax=Streptomyces sp. DH41 TaxID=3040125 RepID=UPI00244109D6|nr:hypothetical protein [Streptomyces sp. DH41]MDG9723155.1 hypothetical protein [Streptomyces sp. DH41]
MARFQHTVTLVPVPRRWFESCVTTLHDLAESLDADGARLGLPDGRPLPGLVLAEGSHLRPGARYRPVREEDGLHWRVTVKARVEGRSFARPLLPVVTAVMGRRARRAFAESLDGAARQWNARLPELVRKQGEEPRAELTDALLAP